MPTSNFRQSVIALVLVALLGAPLTSAAAPRVGIRPFHAQDAYSEAVAWLWSFVARRWSKEGCRIDPNGRCVSDSLESTDNGCRIDPDGHCAESQETTKNGCLIDPNGRCIP